MMNPERIWTLLARKLSGEASPEELKEIEALLKEFPDAHLHVQAVTETWNRSLSPDAGDAQDAYDRLSRRLNSLGYGFSEDPANENFPQQQRLPWYRTRRFIRIAAIFLVMLSGTAAWLVVKRERPSATGSVAGTSVNNRITTRYGSRTKVELPDGSIVWLNSGSTLTYDKQFGDTTREVRLSGEGFFNVVHKASKPFIIHTSYIDIKDLGTQFNVKCYPDDRLTETSLVEGSVEITVKKRGEKYTLKPNQKLVLLNEAIKTETEENGRGGTKVTYDEPIMAIKTLTYKPNDSIAVETAWAYNKLSFADEPFSEVTKKLSRWFNIEFEFRNKSLENERLTGSFPTQTTLEQAMEALKYGYRFSYELKDDKVIIY
jgi:ferric-dicitrate binding protein FerR (iron transport regulator)